MKSFIFRRKDKLFYLVQRQKVDQMSSQVKVSVLIYIFASSILFFDRSSNICQLYSVDKYHSLPSFDLNTLLIFCTFLNFYVSSGARKDRSKAKYIEFGLFGIFSFLEKLPFKHRF